MKFSLQREWSGWSVLTNGKRPQTIFPVFVSFRFVFRALTLSAWNWLPQLWSEHHVVSVGQRGIQTPWKNLKLLCRRSGGGHIKSFNYVTSLYILHTVRVASFCCLMLTFLLLKRPSLCDKAPLYACISLLPLFFFMQENHRILSSWTSPLSVLHNEQSFIERQLRNVFEWFFECFLL